MRGARIAGATAGGLLAGLGITLLMMSGDRKTGKPSERVVIGRAAAHIQGFVPPPESALPNAAEQAVAQGGHLLLSAIAGATYAVCTLQDSNPVSSGVGFGLAFYAAMHWCAGPLLGLKKPEWQSPPDILIKHTLNHVAFGLLTALGARSLSDSSSRLTSFTTH